MESLYRKFGRDEFEILAVSIDTLGSKAVGPFMKKHKLTFPALIDADVNLAITYRTTGVPESFIVDREGTLVRKIIGPIDWVTPDAISFFRDLIEGQPSEHS